MFRELLKKVLELKIGVFGRDEFTKLQKTIQDKLNSVVGNAKSNFEHLLEENLILRDLVEQFLGLEIGLFNASKVANFQKTARATFDKLRGR